MRIDTAFVIDYKEYYREYYKTGETGKDPDSINSTLHTFHLLLWNKPLPCGRIFNLKSNKKKYNYRLLHNSDLGDFNLSSDAMISTYTDCKGESYKKPDTSDIIKDIPKEDIVTFFNLCCTIGGYIVFPANKKKGNTINQLRWTILRDRFDLTLECIRLWYIGEKNELSECLDRYSDFFRLFSDFKGYIEFFLLDDLVDEDGKVRFWLDPDFGTPLPKNPEEYRKYMKNVSDFIEARNRQIDKQKIIVKNLTDFL